MKIFYIDEKFEYGKPELGFSSTYRNYYESLVKMNNEENEVIFFPIDVLIKEKGLEETNKELLELTLKEKPDLVFFWGGLGLIKKEVIKKISQISKTVTWSLDDHWSFYKSSKYSALLFNWVFTSDPLAIEKYRKVGQKNAVFMPQGYNHFLFKPLNLPKIYDVTFVGRPHGDRRRTIKKLRRKGIEVKCFGEGWLNGYVSHEEMIKIFSQSKINLNFTRSSGVLWKQIGLIFLHRKFDRSLGLNSPLKWYENFQVLLAQKRKQLKGRMFKIMGCGGFFLTDPTEGLEILYTPGKEIECFSNFNELVEKIRYYLTHNEEREKIAQAGYERSLCDHTCEKRFNEIFKIVSLRK